MSNDTRPILDYASLRARPRSGLDLQESDGQVKIFFPVAGRWVFMIPFALAVCVGLAILFRLIPSMSSFCQACGIGTGLLEWAEQESSNLGVTGMCFALAVFSAVAYLKWTREAEMLVATSDGLLWSRLGLLGRRTRWWPAQEIVAIELHRRWGNVAVVGAAEMLHVLLQSGCTRRFYLQSSSRRLPRSIAERLAQVLGRPLR